MKWNIVIELRVLKLCDSVLNIVTFSIKNDMSADYETRIHFWVLPQIYSTVYDYETKYDRHLLRIHGKTL